MTIGQGDALAGDLLLRVGVDASGAAAEVTAKLTAAERAAVASGDRIAAGYAAGAEKATVAQLRVVAATEKVNKVLRDEKATLGQRASAQASLITAQQRYTAELNKTERAAVAVNRVEKDRLGFLKTSLATGLGVGGTQLLFSTIRQSKDAAIAYQDVVAANDVVFGRQRRQLDEFKAQQADAFNLSRLQSEELANTFGSVFKTAGLAQGTALEQGLELTKRVADVRSFRGGRLEDVRDAFRSALVGETEPIRRYGVLLDDARLRLRALDMGLVASTKETLPPAIKAQAAYAEILAQTSDAAGDVARTSDSAANKIEDSRQKAADARQELGEGLLPVISELATAGSELAPAMAGVARGLSAVLSNDFARRSIAFGLAAAGVVKLTSALSDFASRTAGKIGANLALARSYDVVATSAGRAAVAEGVASGAGGVVAGRGRRFASAAGGLGVVGLGLGATGAVGAATGSGLLNDVTTIAGATATGALIGSAFPGPGTAIGAGIGGLIGIGGAIFGPDGTAPETTRSASRIRQDLARVNFELNQLRSGAVENPTRGFELQARQGDLAKELQAAKAAARETTQVVDPLTGKFRNMTQAQIEAANAAAIHKNELVKEREAFDDLRDSFRVDPFAEQAKSVKASTEQIRIAELRLQAARERARKDGATTSERASVLSAQATLDRLRSQGGATGISAEEALDRLRGNVTDQRDLRRDFRSLARRGASRETLDALRGLEAQAPGTVARIANADGKRYVREFDKALRQLNREATLFARLFDGTDTLAEEKGRRDARAYRRGLEDVVMSGEGFRTGVFGPVLSPQFRVQTAPSRAADRQADYAYRNRSRRAG